MVKKATFLLLLFLLVVGVLTLTIKIQPAKALNLTIYILPNGTVSGTSSIQTADNATYTLTANINNQSVIVERNNTVIDGNGHTVQGAGSSTGYGITLSSVNNVTLENITIASFQYGIYVYSSCHISLFDNNATQNYFGIYLISSPASTMRNNKMNNNTCNLAIFGLQSSDYIDSIYASNLVNGRPVYYYVNQSGLAIIPSMYPSIGYLALINCTNITVEHLTLTNNGQGILLVATNNSNITKNNLTNDIAGIDLENSQHNMLSTNNLTENLYWGISSHYSSYNMLSDNNASGNGFDGIGLYFSAYNTASDDTASQNGNQGIELYSCFNNTVSSSVGRKNNFNGIDLDNSTYNTLSGNILSGNLRSGIDLDASSKDNAVSGNGIIENSVGIWLSQSSSNAICNNNFINNTRQVNSDGSPNTWDNGAKGNYWSDYTSKYPNASERDSTGTWNMSYVIDANNVDNHPLMNQPIIPELPSYLMLPLMMITTLIAVTICRRKHKAKTIFV